MKTVNITKHPLTSDNEVVCPYCGKLTTVNPIDPISNRVYNISPCACAHEHRFPYTKKKISGDFNICEHCEEMFFIYQEQDCRVCRQCIYVDVNNPYGELLYSCKIKKMFVGPKANGLSYICDKFEEKDRK